MVLALNAAAAARPGAGHLADVGVVLASELAVRLLDVVLRRAARHAQGLVVVLVLGRHVQIPRQCKWPAGTATGAGETTPSHGVISVSVAACKVTCPIAKRSRIRSAAARKKASSGWPSGIARWAVKATSVVPVAQT